jgi:menaquinone-9 beta-reductase
MSGPATGEPLWDLVVVGAGPAGTATALGALAADPTLRVLLLDRADFPRDKSCGDGIAPEAVDALASVGAGDVVEGWAPIERLELAGDRARVSRALSRPVWVVPREVFDARLVGHATRAGAVLRRHRVRDVEVASDAVAVDGDTRARVVVGADGAHSVVRSRTGAAGAAGAGRRAIAIRGYAPTPPSRRNTQLIAYGDRRQPSYAWAFDRGDGLCNVGYGELLDDHSTAPSRDLLLGQLDRLVPGAGGGVRDWRAHHLPLSRWRFTQADGPVLLAGDAAGLVNPMTGEGIYYAVASGILAGRAAAAAVRAASPHAAGSAYRSALRALLGRHLRHTFVTSRLTTVPAVVDAGIRAAARDQGVFDDLVEIGLGQGVVSPRLVTGLVRSLFTGSPGRPADPLPSVTQ